MMKNWLDSISTGRFGQDRKGDWYKRLAVVVTTLALVQAALLGWSLTGSRVMLPLGLLKVQNPAILVVDAPEEAGARKSLAGLDLVLQFEPFRKFVVQEVRAGRFPLWNRYSYSGSPFVANAQSGVMSPYRAVDIAINDPVSTAWAQLFKGLVAGLGMYLFLRIALKVRFLPALAGAHLFVLLGFMMFFCGHPHTQVLSWLGWVMLGCDRLVRRPGPGWLALASGSAALCFYSGHPQTTAHVYLCAGVWTLGLLAHTAWRKPVRVTMSRVTWIVVAGVVAGLLAGPQLLPTLEYLPWSLRLEARAAGKAVYVVSGLPGLMDMLMPYFNGSPLNTTLFFGQVNHAESMASGSVGLVWALFFAPVGVWALRKDARGWVVLALLVLGLGYPLGVPVLKLIYEHGPLAMLSPNRLVVLAGIAVIVLGAAGLDRLVRGHVPSWRVIAACVTPCVAVLGVLVYTINGANQMAANPEAGPEMVATANWFVRVFAIAGAAVLVLIAGYVALAKAPRVSKAIGAGLAGVALIEVVVLAWGLYPSAPKAEFYPRLSVLEWVSGQTGIDYRACGYQGLPANLNLTYNIADPRGYDALDPKPMVKLLEAFRSPGVPRLDPDYAAVLVWTPKRSPLLAMLAVKYLIIRGRVPEGMKPAYAGDGYWVMELPDTPSRVYVPSSVVAVPDAETRMKVLTAPDFLPTKMVVVETPLAQVREGQNVVGRAKLISDTGSEVVFQANMETPGVVVLADMWYPGWHATVDGEQVDILRVNTTLKGVALGPGEHEVKLVYWPASFVKGLVMFVCGVVALLAVWGVRLATRRRVVHDRPRGSMT